MTKQLSLPLLELWLNQKVLENGLDNLTIHVNGPSSLMIKDNKSTDAWILSMIPLELSGANKYLSMRGITDE